MVDRIEKNEAKPQVQAAEYIFRRLKQIGVLSVHGVPGDYNLEALDYLEKSDLRWVGNINELNAAYAADGYARVAGISAIVTTFGVGELSAINGIAGAYAEHIPVVHIVGSPSRTAQHNQLLLHHTLGNGDFNVFRNSYSSISCVLASIDDPENAPVLIDDALRECWIKCRPVYLQLPTDMIHKNLNGERLLTPIDLSEPANNIDAEREATEIILKHVYAANTPIILADAGAIRYRALDEVYKLALKSNLPIFVTPMGKSAVLETLKSFGGVYTGHASLPRVKERVESADLILSIGSLKSDFNTAQFTSRIQGRITIDFNSDHCTVLHADYRGLRIKGLLQKIIHDLDPTRVPTIPSMWPETHNDIPEHQNQHSVITHEWFWPRIGEFFGNGDIIITETGTANFGILDSKFPTGVLALNQVLWGSVGWALGACQGAALAVRDKGQDRRTILFIGDGSFQLTAQELSTIVRHGLTPIIFLLCNKGFTIERTIHGQKAGYNDIPDWDFKELLTVFKAEHFRKFQIRAQGELESLLNDSEFNSPKCIQFVELFLDKDDVPRALKLTSEASN